jgi:insertion element IS1 protein InsB
LTAHVERFFGTLRQRCARLVRKTLSFSRKMENHVGALWYFIRCYNLCRA